MKNNITTIIRKEFARFFGDRALFFTAVIMPGLMIYLIYTLMGSFMSDNVSQKIDKHQQAVEAKYQSPMTPEEESLCDSLMALRQSAMQEAEAAVGEDEEALGSILGNLIPMLIITLLFSGCMAVAPTAIAGEKERGTIATLLVTPMKRSELATGKIISLSCIALLSGLSSFLGIILSLPKMLEGDTEEMSQIDGVLYGSGDYLLLFLLIVSTVLIIISVISILSAWAKDVKSAGTMVSPLMICIIMASLTPMMGTPSNNALYLIPIYNSAQAMSSVLSFKVEVVPLVITICSNLCYTALAIAALTKMFNSEKVMFRR